jgi:negative regulator of sigma-B (phosphoserine phosphatase)
MGAEKLNRVDTALIELGVAEWRLEAESGDAYVAHAFPGGVLVAVIDGLGHGPDAAAAASAAVDALTLHAPEPPEELLIACHEALRPTRGAVISLASLRDGGSMSWAGVGNVQGALVRGRADEPVQLLTTLGGILGHAVPNCRAVAMGLVPGDALVFTTDGVRSGAAGIFDRRADAQTNAERVLADSRIGRDDALVLVARYRGERP